MAEIGFRLLPNSFFLVIDQHDYDIEGTLDYTAVDLAIETLPAADVVIAGTSRAREGIRVPALQQELRRRTSSRVQVRNYATAGGRVDVWLALVERLIHEGQKPEVLVVALDGSDFRDLDAPSERYRLIDVWTLPDDIARNGWPGERDMTNVIGNSIPLRMVRSRPTIRYRVVERGDLDAKAIRMVNAAFGGLTGWAREYEARKETEGTAPRMRGRSDRIRHALVGYVFHERGFARLRELVDVATSRGIKIVLAEIPASPPLQGEEMVQLAQARLRSEMAALARHELVWAWSAEDATGFGKTTYRDPSHLNMRGATRLTDMIETVVLEALGVPEAPRP